MRSLLALLRALGLLLSRPKLLALASLPALAAFLLTTGAIATGVAYGGELLDLVWTAPEQGVAAQGAWWALWGVAQLATAAVVVILMPWLVMLVGFPLCEPLAEATEQALGVELPPSDGFLAEVLRGLRSSIGLLIVGVGGSVVFLALGLIPGVGLLTGPFVALVWTPLFLAFDLLDGGLARRQLGFRRKLGVVRRNLLSCWVLGLCALALISIPFLNLLGLPWAVTAGTVLVRDLERSGSLDP